MRFRIVATSVSILVASSVVLAATASAAPPLLTSRAALTAALPTAQSLGPGWATLVPAQYSADTKLQIGGAGCGSAKSGRGDEIQGYFDSADSATLAIALISVSNAPGDFSRLRRIYSSGCLEALRVQGRTARSHYKVAARFTSNSGIGLQANTAAFGGDTYEFLYGTLKGSILAVIYYRGLSQPDSAVIQAVISGFRHAPSQ